MSAGGLRGSFGLGGLAGVYLVALVLVTQAGLGLGQGEIAAVRGQLHPSVSYRADLPLVSWPVPAAAIMPAPAGAPPSHPARGPVYPPALAAAVAGAAPLLAATLQAATTSQPDGKVVKPPRPGRGFDAGTKASRRHHIHQRGTAAGIL